MEMKDKINIFIQARQKSKRFPNKILSKIKNKFIFQIIFERLRLSKYSSQPIFLIPKNETSLKKILLKNKIPYFLGSEENLINRFYDAAKKNNTKIIVRITADCPLVDAMLIDKMIEFFLKNDLDYISNTYPPSFPDGLDVEIFKFDALSKMRKSNLSKSNKEHLTSFIKENPNLFKIGNVFLKDNEDYSKYRITLDYKDDLELIKSVYSKFHPKINFNYIKILNYLKDNKFINHKYMRNINFEVSESKNLWKKALKLIPDGNSFLSKHPKSFNEESWPIYYSSTSKQFITSLDKKKYLDMSMMSVGTNLLGYNNFNVDKEIKKVIKKGNMSSLNCPEEVELAERLTDMHDWSDMAKFARTGAEANCIALRAARLTTGKEKIIICGYHGWHDWYLAANLKDNSNLNNHLFKNLKISGVPNNLKNFIYSFEYNNLKSLKKIINSDNNIAAIIMEVKRDKNPTKNFLKEIRKICDNNNIILIFDECTSAFRENFGGLHLKYNVKPDLAMFGKALGNGYPITSVIGKKNIMENLSNSFVSSTFWSDRIGPTAGISSLKEMEKRKSWKLLTLKGNYFRKKFNVLDDKNFIQINKEGIIPNISLKLNNYRANKKNLISFFLRHNIITSDRIYLSTEHTFKNIDYYFKIMQKFLNQCKDQKYYTL